MSAMRLHRAFSRRVVAYTLLPAIRRALAGGLVHRNHAGDVLRTEWEVLDCLRFEGIVNLDPLSSDGQRG